MAFQLLTYLFFENIITKTWTFFSNILLTKLFQFSYMMICTDTKKNKIKSIIMYLVYWHIFQRHLFNVQHALKVYQQKMPSHRLSWLHFELFKTEFSVYRMKNLQDTIEIINFMILYFATILLSMWCFSRKYKISRYSRITLCISLQFELCSNCGFSAKMWIASKIANLTWKVAFVSLRTLNENPSKLAHVTQWTLTLTVI